MYKSTNSLVAATTGTTLMTLFTYLVSIAEKENLSEPEHLGTLMHRLVPGSSKKLTQAAGWGTHYMVGLAFVLAYQELWQKGKIEYF